MCSRLHSVCITRCWRRPSDPASHTYFCLARLRFLRESRLCFQPSTHARTAGGVAPPARIALCHGGVALPGGVAPPARIELCHGGVVLPTQYQTTSKQQKSSNCAVLGCCNRFLGWGGRGSWDYARWAGMGFAFVTRHHVECEPCWGALSGRGAPAVRSRAE